GVIFIACGLDSRMAHCHTASSQRLEAVMCSLVPEPPVCFYCRLPLALDEFGQCKECLAAPIQKKCACGDLTPNTSGVCNACAVIDLLSTPSAADRALTVALGWL